MHFSLSLSKTLSLLLCQARFCTHGEKIEFTPNCKPTVDRGIVRVGHPQPETELSSQGGQDVPTVERAMCTSLAMSLGPFLLP